MSRNLVEILILLLVVRDDRLRVYYLVESGQDPERPLLVGKFPVDQKIIEVHSVFGLEDVANRIPRMRFIVSRLCICIGQKPEIVLHAVFVLLCLREDVQIKMPLGKGVWAVPPPAR